MAEHEAGQLGLDARFALWQTTFDLRDGWRRQKAIKSATAIEQRSAAGRRVKAISIRADLDGTVTRIRASR